MTTRHTLFIYIAAITLCACGNKKTTESLPAPAEEENEVKTTDASDEVKAVYIPIDATCFGFKAKPKHVETSRYSTNSYDGKLEEGTRLSSTTMTFDAFGHVTTDPWGNSYGYDAEGNYYRGNHLYTKVVRDKAERIIKYQDVEPNTQNETNLTLLLGYDKNSRMIKVSLSSETTSWTQTLQYSKGDIFPSSSVKTISYEGTEYDEVHKDTYTYSHFDDMGNWTERVCVSSFETQEEEYDSWNDSTFVKTKVIEQIFIEKREIEYYE